MKQKPSGFELMLNLAFLFCKPYFCGMMGHAKGQRMARECGNDQSLKGEDV